MTKKPETLKEWKDTATAMARLLIMCRDALPAIPAANLRLYNIAPDLDQQIERVLEPWVTTADDPEAI